MNSRWIKDMNVNQKIFLNLKRKSKRLYIPHRDNRVLKTGEPEAIK